MTDIPPEATRLGEELRGTDGPDVPDPAGLVPAGSAGGVA